jgi:hypothetical protein
MSKPQHADGTETVARPVFYRATFSLPAALAKDISHLAKRLGVSQSAMLAELLTEPVAAMREVIDTIPQVGVTPTDVKRARGKSAALIRDVVQHAQSLLATELSDEDRQYLAEHPSLADKLP